MDKITMIYTQSQLSLAAYADLQKGIINPIKLLDDAVGMTQLQANKFASEWSVVDVVDSPTGLHATIFRNNKTGKNHLAIRGTDRIGDILANAVIIDGTPVELNPQYIALAVKVDEWIDNGELSSGFTVTGHSLGGYLAAYLTINYPDNVTHAYLYNSPGNTDDLSSVLENAGITNPIDINKITNIRAEAGISPIADLGKAFDEPKFIAIEDQFLSDVQNPPLARNHSQRVLTDTLAVYALFGELSPKSSVEDISNILKSTTRKNVETLESTISDLSKLYIPTSTSIEPEDRSAMYEAIYALQENILFKQSSGLVEVKNLSDKTDSQLLLLAQTDIAYRYALVELNSFVIAGDNALYAHHNENGELELYDPESQSGTLTEQYLIDRAKMLQVVLDFSENDYSDKTSVAGETSRIYEDVERGLKLQGSVSVRDQLFLI